MPPVCAQNLIWRFCRRLYRRFYRRFLDVCIGKFPVYRLLQGIVDGIEQEFDEVRAISCPSEVLPQESGRCVAKFAAGSIGWR